MTKNKQNKGLGNPVVTAVAAGAGQEVVKSTASVIPFLIKTTVFIGLGYWAYRSFVTRFVPLKEVNSWPASSITNGQATTRAEMIYQAMEGFGANFQIVASNLSSLNYNGWVRLYNAFGNRRGANPLGKKMDLVEWLGDQFDEEELAQLRFLVPNVF